MEKKHEALREGLKRLSPQERDVIRWRFGLDGKKAVPVAEIAARLGVDTEAVESLTTTALRKLRWSATTKRFN